MEDEQFQRAILTIVKQISTLAQNLIELRVAVNVLKVSVAGLASPSDPQAVLTVFQTQEKNILDSNPDFQAGKEFAEISDLLEKWKPGQES
jgi:hypothetical protein